MAEGKPSAARLHGKLPRDKSWNALHQLFPGILLAPSGWPVAPLQLRSVKSDLRIAWRWLLS